MVDNFDKMKSMFKNTEKYGDFNSLHAIKALSGALSFKTVSPDDDGVCDVGAFQALHKFLEEMFPLCHSVMEKEVVNDCSLLFKWAGSGGTSKKPILFMSHLDVVPVNEGTEDDWEHDAYSGDVVDGVIWGRGAIDTKSQVVAELAAAEYLISKGFKPDIDIYFCFGHDEEVMGTKGTLAVKNILQERGVVLEFLLDEGGGFQDGELYGAPGATFATISVFEKGYSDISVTAHSPGGHSSNPGKGTSLGKVATALSKIEAAQFSSSLWPPLKKFFKSISGSITAEPLKSIVAGMDKDEQPLIDFLENHEKLSPYVKTTTAINMITGGSPQPNVMPQTVEAIINFRLGADDSCEDVINHCINAVNDPEVEIKFLKGLEPSNISLFEGYAFDILSSAVAEFYKDVITVPNVAVGGTDARYFEDICESCYRFRPFMDNKDLYKTVHSTNERCSSEGYIHGTKLIIKIMEDAAS